MKQVIQRLEETSHEGSAALLKATPLAIVDRLARRLVALAEALELGAECIDDVDRVFRSVVARWSRVGVDPTSRGPDWVSEVSDDNTPIEFSITLSPTGPEARILFEPQGEPQSLAENRRAALAMHDELARDFGADLSRFRLVQDLFLPDEMQGPFALWSAVVFARGKAPRFEAHFNTQAQGVGQASRLVERALERLGVPEAWSKVTSDLTRRGPHFDELKYLALDLAADARSRVKVYVRHHDSTPADLERAARLSGGYVPGEVDGFARALSGDKERFSGRATFSDAAFVEGSGAVPPSTTHHVPVCAYAETDAVVERRVTRFLVEQGLDATAYTRALTRFAERPLTVGVGMQSWVALGRWEGVPRVTICLGSESNTVFQAGAVPAATSQHIAFASAEDVIRSVGRYSLADHPLVHEIARTRNSELLWLLIHNTYQGTSVRFAPWLAWVTAVVEDERARSLLARQLNEELGDGEVERAHSQLMTSFLRALEPLKPPVFPGGWTDPGFALRGELERLYRSSDQYEALAALMAGEICAHQLIASVGELLEPHLHRLDRSQLTWLTHHNEVEGGHADESIALASFIPAQSEPIQSVVRGAFGLHAALWRSMDDLFAHWSATRN